MDIQLIDKGSIKLRTKLSTIIINPSMGIPKTEADAVLFLGEESPSKASDYRVSIAGPGEYEVSGVKVTGVSIGGENIYYFDADNIKLLLGKMSVLKKIAERSSESHIVLTDVDELDDSVIARIGPRVAILYGEKNLEALKDLGKENSQKTSKYSTTFEKLPEEMEVVALE